MKGIYHKKGSPYTSTLLCSITPTGAKGTVSLQATSTTAQKKHFNIRNPVLPGITLLTESSLSDLLKGPGPAESSFTPRFASKRTGQACEGAVQYPQGCHTTTKHMLQELPPAQRCFNAFRKSKDEGLVESALCLLLPASWYSWVLDLVSW